MFLPMSVRVRKRAWVIVGVLAAVLCLLPGTPATAEEKPAATERLRPSGIDGALVISGGGKVPDAVRDRFLQLAGGAKADLVVLTGPGEDAEGLLDPWKARKPASVVALPLPAKAADADDKLLEPLQRATGVWIEGDQPALTAKTLAGTALEKALRALLQRGGVVGGNAAGLDLLPGAVAVPHFQAEQTPRLLGVLDKQPGLVGVGVAEETALVIQGRQLRVLGDGTVTVCLARSPKREPRTIELKPGGVADLTALRRAAVARGEPPFPPEEGPVPEVVGGALVIVGGGGMPADVTQKFLDLAGGPEALIVVLPTANPDPLPPGADAGLLKRAGAKNLQVLPGRERKDVESDEYLNTLKKAGGVWFGGGRQWRFVDAYEGTKAHELLRDVLRRGGVIGGSSAGATIQGDYLCRGSPFGNEEIMYEGYERGLGFLPGVAIDQHFTQRKRFADMTSLVKTYPQLLGIGLDEATALVVKGHAAEVMGKSQAHFYDRKKPAEEGKPDYEAVKAGGRYDLKERKVLPHNPQ